MRPEDGSTALVDGLGKKVHMVSTPAQMAIFGPILTTAGTVAGNASEMQSMTLTVRPIAH